MFNVLLPENGEIKSTTALNKKKEGVRESQNTANTSVNNQIRHSLPETPLHIVKRQGTVKYN